MKNNTDDNRPHQIVLAQEWSWADRYKGCKRRVRSPAFLSCLLAALLFLAIFPANAVPILLYCFSFFIVLMAILRLIAVVITIQGQKLALYATDVAIGDFPHFTILVPLYKEAHMVTSLMQHLSKIDYPADKINIIIITETDDLPTCQAVKANIRPPFQLFEVPPSLPRTKPKALNAALASIPGNKLGDIITVYDAEDRPHPQQLKQAARRFAADPELAALQAPLGYYNDRETLLTAQFGLEYAALFHVWNPALAKLGIPFTLGGTSNHIRRDVLEQCGGWDAYNVTEDADLSFRISAMNNASRKLKIGTIALPTAEEAVSTYSAWTAQRSRWLKGFMQTWRVHMRTHKFAPDGSPLPMLTRVKNIFALQITVGATLLAAYLHVPSLIIMCGMYIADAFGFVTLTWPLPILSIMVTGYSAAILTGIIGVLRAKKSHLIKHAPLMPFYWLLHFRPALIAAYEIVAAPTHWRKTPHIGTPETQSCLECEQTLEQTNSRLI